MFPTRAGPSPDDEDGGVADSGAVSTPALYRVDAGPVIATDRIRWSDVDPLGIIRYDSYVRLLEIGETELFRAAGLPYAVIREQMGVWLPRRRLAFEYHTAARLDDVVEVRAWFGAVGTTSLTLAFQFVDAPSGVLRASAELVVVCVERDTLAKFAVPDAVRTAIAPWVERPRDG
jgi:YbgC/YbaW family acyl-CoA thioester hydrolase